MTSVQIMPLGPILRASSYEAAMKNKSYRSSPVGRQVGRFIGSLRWQDYSVNTRDSYETTGARLAVDHDDFAGLQDFCSPVGDQYLREFLDRHWSEAAAATKANRTAAVRAIFRWAVDEGICAWDPAAKLKAPRSRKRAERQAYPQEILHRLVAAQDSLRDQCALQLLGRLGLRKGELRVLRVGEIDLVRNLLTVHGKGGNVAVMPIGYPSLAQDLYLHIQGEGRKPDEYLMYPKSRRRDPMDPSSLHDWFKRCLARAGLPATVKLHELRHTAADHVYRQTGDIIRASQLLRHSSVVTTQTYLHPTRRDLALALELIDQDWSK